MNRVALSPAASALLRAFIARARVPRDRILLTNVETVDWQSLTFVGERHRFELRVLGLDSKTAAERLCHGLEDAEFSIPELIVADISVPGEPVRAIDGSTTVIIEALTIDE